ncbi:MAG: tetratricopeptide repeat protein, partial [Ferruginibacter sp.]
DDPKNCYYRASMKYAQALFAEAISLAEKCIAGNPNPYPKLYGIEGYAYNRLGDSVKAKAAFESYFQKGDTSQIGMGDYATYASVLLKFPGNDTLAGKYVDKAVELDTLEANKLTYLTNIASYYVMQKNYKEAADWYSKILKVRKDTRKTDLFNAGNNYAKAKEFPAAIEVFDQYIQKFPNESMGYYMNARNYLNIDSTDAEGKGLAYYNKIVDMADSIKDKPGEKERIKYSLQYLIEYSANVKKDKAASLAYVDRGLALDSTDAEFKNMREVISNANFSAPRNQSPKQDKPATPKAGSKPSAEKPNATKQPADSGNK